MTWLESLTASPIVFFVPLAVWLESQIEQLGPLRKGLSPIFPFPVLLTILTIQHPLSLQSSLHSVDSGDQIRKVSVRLSVMALRRRKSWYRGWCGLVTNIVIQPLKVNCCFTHKFMFDLPE